MAKQPTATAFVRTQGSFARFMLKKVRAEIEEFENGAGPGEDPELERLYDEEYWWERYADTMDEQREFLKVRYLT